LSSHWKNGPYKTETFARSKDVRPAGVAFLRSAGENEPKLREYWPEQQFCAGTIADL
jgi:hypothetical protein